VKCGDWSTLFLFSAGSFVSQAVQKGIQQGRKERNPRGVQGEYVEGRTVPRISGITFVRAAEVREATNKEPHVRPRVGERVSL
jgi:hypothetical protein